MSNLLSPFVPILCVGSKFDTPIYYIGMKTDEKEMVKLTEDMTCESKAQRELNRIRQEMGNLWLKANVGRMQLFNTDSDITKREDFLQFQMELYNRYRPLPCLPVMASHTDCIHKDDMNSWKKNEKVFIGAYIATKHPTWTVRSVLERGSMGHEIFVEKDGETRRVLFCATGNTFIHDADARPINS